MTNKIVPSEKKIVYRPIQYFLSDTSLTPDAPPPDPKVAPPKLPSLFPISYSSG
jgi:hypothetical protein